nr:glycosyl hydrolase [Chitinophagales bacterium]
MKLKIFLLLILSFFNSLAFNSFAQKSKDTIAIESFPGGYDPLLFQGLRWRSIGPWRGGRSLAVCGVIGQPNIYYFGAVGGGIWKTEDGGQTWLCISDSAFHSSSVGAITVAPSDANIIYAGMGEAEMRGNISFGDGVYKSTDCGKTWRHIGLKESYAIQNIIVHPDKPGLLYASCMGKIFGSNKERGLY